MKVAVVGAGMEAANGNYVLAPPSGDDNITVRFSKAGTSIVDGKEVPVDFHVDKVSLTNDRSRWTVGYRYSTRNASKATYRMLWKWRPEVTPSLSKSAGNEMIATRMHVYGLCDRWRNFVEIIRIGYGIVASHSNALLSGTPQLQ